MRIPRVKIPTPATPICDFCSATPVVWDYPARDFSHGDRLPTGERITFNSHEGWAACIRCKGMIDRGERDRLARRSVKRFRVVHAQDRPITLNAVRALHDRFWRNREGPGQPARERHGG